MTRNIDKDWEMKSLKSLLPLLKAAEPFSKRNSCNGLFDDVPYEFMRQQNDRDCEESIDGFNEEKKASIFTGSDGYHKPHGDIELVETIDNELTAEEVVVNSSELSFTSEEFGREINHNDRNKQQKKKDRQSKRNYKQPVRQ